MYPGVPKTFLEKIGSGPEGEPASEAYCAGFELEEWRCDALADHLIEWIADFALWGDELEVDHTTMYQKLREAAARIYSSEKYETRGEVGELLLHAICRNFFGTISIAPRLFHKTASNDIVKSFDLIHARHYDEQFEIWLGEAKFYQNSLSAVKAAVASVEEHITADFLKNEKLLIAPQIPRDVPRSAELRELLISRTSLDKLFETAVFPICIAAESDSLSLAKTSDETYRGSILLELENLRKVALNSSLAEKIRVVLLYVPLKSKLSLATAFHTRLKGLKP